MSTVEPTAEVEPTRRFVRERRRSGRRRRRYRRTSPLAVLGRVNRVKRLASGRRPFSTMPQVPLGAQPTTTPPALTAHRPFVVPTTSYKVSMTGVETDVHISQFPSPESKFHIATLGTANPRMGEIVQTCYIPIATGPTNQTELFYHYFGGCH